MSKIKNILIATDFSAQSDHALDEAFVLADTLAATVHLLHVFTLQDKSELDLCRIDMKELMETERRKLAAAADAHRASHRVGEVIWQMGDPAPAIVKAASDLHAELIVIGASGRSGIRRIVLGSVAESVTRHATCSVLVVRDAETIQN